MADGIRFLDSNTFIGQPTRRGCWEPATAQSLVTAMDQAGIERSLVWHIAQHDAHPNVGNDLLMRDIEGAADRLIPCWAIPCPYTDELNDMDGWFARAIGLGVRAMRICRTRGSYLMRREVIGGIVERLLHHQLPLVYSIERGGNWDELYDLLQAFPQLRVIVSDVGVWPCDRVIRPLFELYPHVHLELSQYFVPGGIESIVHRYGPGRLLYGSGYPACYHGAMMLMVMHARIDQNAKCVIAGGNLQRLVDEVKQ